MSGQEKAGELRSAFDLTFALPPPARAADTEDLLAIGVAGHRHAVRLRDIDGMVAWRKVVYLPGSDADCLGVAGLRGAAVPIFDLAALLGYAAATGDDTPRWLLLSGRDDSLALAFTDFEGYLRVPKSAFQGADGAQSVGGRTNEVVRLATEVRSIINVPQLVATIRARAGRSR